MDEKDLKALFRTIPQGMFSNEKELKDLIESEGVGVLYSVIPQGMFSSKEEFESTFSEVKKKENSEVTSPREGTVSPTEQVVEEPTSAESSVPVSSQPEVYNLPEGGINTEEIQKTIDESNLGFTPGQIDTRDKQIEATGKLETERKNKDDLLRANVKEFVPRDEKDYLDIMFPKAPEYNPEDEFSNDRIAIWKSDTPQWIQNGEKPVTREQVQELREYGGEYNLDENLLPREAAIDINLKETLELPEDAAKKQELISEINKKIYTVTDEEREAKQFEIDALKAKIPEGYEGQMSLEFKQKTSKDPFERAIITITPEMIDEKSEEATVAQLNKLFNQYGFSFEETSVGESLKGYSKNGKEVYVDIDTWFSDKGEAKNLKSFLEDNRIENEVILEKENKFYQKSNEKVQTIIDEKDLLKRQNGLNNELEQFKDDYSKTVNLAAELKEMNFSDQGYNEKSIELLSLLSKVKESKKSIKETQSDLNKLTGEYLEWEKEKWDVKSIVAQSLIKGVVDIGTGVADFGLSVAGVAGYYAGFEGTGIADARDALYEGKAAITKDLEWFGSTEAAISALEQDSFIGGALIGMVKSLPSMAVGIGSAGVMSASMRVGIAQGAMTFSAIEEEFRGMEGYADLTEAEKLAVKLPAAIIGAALEKVGFESMFKNTGFMNKVLLDAFNKIPKNADALLIKQTLERTALEAVKEFGKKTGKAAAGEFLTGASQEVSDITIKGLYNTIKNSEVAMFQTPESLVEGGIQVLEAGGQEAIGGFAMTAPGAVVSAFNTGKGMDLPNGIFEMFDKVSKDDNFNSLFVSSLKSKIANKEITKSEAQKQLDDYRELGSVMKEIPKDYTNDQKKEAIGLIKDKKSIEKSIEGIPPDLVISKKEELAGITEKMKAISSKTDVEYAAEKIQRLEANKAEILENNPEQLKMPIKKGSEVTLEQAIDSEITETKKRLEKPKTLMEKAKGFFTRKSSTEEAPVQTEANNKAEAYATDEVIEIGEDRIEEFVASQAEAKAQRTDDALQDTPLTVKEVRKIKADGGKIFMTSDGKSGGYVTKDGYIGGIFKQPKSGKRGAAKVMIEAARENGGKFLEAFGINQETGEGTTLEDIYIKSGFRPVARMTFDPEIAPEGWEKSGLKSRPDNVFFAYDPNGDYKAGDGVRIENYNQAYETAKKQANETKTKPEAALKPATQKTSEVEAEVESDKSSEQEVRDIEAFFKEDTDGDVQFQLASKEPAANKKTLVKKAKALMNKLMPKINSESKTVEETQAVSIPIEIKEGSRLHEMLKKTKLGAVELKDLVGKKINLVMADQLVANGKYMGGPMFPFIDSLFGRVAWASMKKGAASSIVNGAIDSDYSVVFNMSPKAVYSNKAFRKEILDSLSNEKQQELFGLIKESETKKSEKEKKAIDESKTLSELFENMNDFNVDQKINFFSKIIPSKTVNSTSGVLGFMQDNGLNLENLSNKLSDELVRDLPLGAMTVVLEVTDKKGNKITSKTKNEAIISREQQAEEGMESHPNYPIYIRGRVVGVLKETVPFWDVLPSYKEIVEKKVLGIIKARNVFSTKYEGKEAKVLEKINEDGSRDLELQVKTGKDFKSKESFNLKKSDKISTKKFIEKNIGAVSKYKEGAQASSKKARAGAYASAMKGAKRAEKVSKNVKSSYSKFVERLSKSFPSVEVVATKEEFNSLLDNLSAKALSTKNQTIYGAVYNGKLYLNPELENFNTPVHEFGHIWLNTAKEMKNNAYEKGIDLIKNSEYVDRVKNNKDYKRVTDKMKKEGATDAEINQYILEEALATAIGDKGESFATAAAERNFKNWLSDLFEFVKKLTGISGLTNEQIQDMNLDEFTQAVVVDIMSEKKLFKDSEVKKLEDALQLMTFTNDYKTMQTIINEARENNFTDAAIKDYLTRVRKFPLKEVNEEMKAKADFFIELPDSFKNMKGGIKAGQALFDKISKFRAKEVRNNKKRKNKISEQEIVDKTIEFMEAQPEFIAEGDTYTVGSKKKGTQVTKTKKSPSSQQIEMLSDLQQSVATTVEGRAGVRPTKNVSEKIRKARLMLSQRKKGARDVSSVITELRNFMRKSLPKYIYTKKEVLDLLKKVSLATQDNIDNLFQEVTEFVTEKNNAALEKAIFNILGGKYDKVESGRLKGVKVDLETKERIESIKSNLANESMTAEDIMAENEKLNAKMNEMQKNPNPTDAELNSMVDMQIVIEYNNSLLMDNRDMNKTASLDFVNNELSDIITKGRSALKQELQEAAQKYRDQRADLYEDITGERVDMDAKDASETLDTAKRKRKSDAKAEKVKNRARTAISKIFDFINNGVFGTAEALDGLMDKISKLPGELFGGKSQELVTEKTDESSRKFKERKMIVEAMIKTKLQDIYGKRWGKKSRNNRVEINTGIVDGFGNEIRMTPNEMAYMYNQYKDPANHPSFETTYGKDYARIMKEMENKLDSNLKKFADWQVNEFFPEVYEHYNDVYKKIYRANMPWNQFYAGKIKKEGVDVEPLDLLSGNGVYNTSVGAASTKARTKNNKAIIPLDITDALASYVNEMEYFAAYAENIRDIDKLFKNEYIQSAITDIHGNQVMNLITDSIKKIANKGRTEGGGDKFFNAANTVFITSRIALSPVIMIKQLTSLFTYANDIGYRNWVKYAAKNKMEQAKVWKEVRDNSVYLKDRKYDSILNTIEVYNETDTKSFIPHPAKQWAVNFLMWNTKKGDIGAIMLGGLPNYSYYKSEFKKKNPKATEQQAIDYAIIKFEKDTKRTQQSSDLQDRDYYQKKGAIWKSLNMFQTSQKQYLRKEIQAVRALSRKVSQWDKNAGKGTIKENIRTFLTYHVFMPVLFQYVAAGFPGLLADWEEEDETDLMRAAILGNLNALFVIGDVFNMFSDYVTGKPWAGSLSRSLGMLQIFSGLVEKRIKFDKTKDNKKKEEALMDFWMEAATITGLPAPTLNKMFENYSNVGTDGSLEKDILRLLNYSEYVIEGKKKTRRKRKSMSMESLKKYAPDVYEEMKEMKKISKIDID